MTLTKTEQEIIARLAKMEGEIILYEETSSSGKSETLRYRRRWAEMGRYGLRERHESHMIFSVKIGSVRGGKYGSNWIDDPGDIEKYNKKCEEARKLFTELRK